jgi:4'-phosphopantetheinyl transferase
MVDIYITRFDKPLSPQLWETYSSLLPPDLQVRNKRFIRWQDRHSHLFGKLLLIKGLEKLSFDFNVLQKLQANDNNRPFLSNINIDFNITHSGKYVLCAMCKQLQVGIDIEECKEMPLDNFEKIMTPSQWKIIYNDPQPLKRFFRFWAIKESVIKADGRGLGIPLDQLETDNNIVVLDNNSWYITELSIDDQYASALATNAPCEYHVNQVNFYEK